MNMMEKKIEDYLHLYLGCECMVDGRKGTIEGVSTSSAGCSGNNPLIYFEDGEVSAGEEDIEDVKPILRPLESMTEEEWVKCFELSRGIVNQQYAGKMQKWSSTEVLFTLGKGQYLFGYHHCGDNDVRISNGICFHSRSYLIQDELSVSEKGIEQKESGFNRQQFEQVLNINHIFLYLLSKHFDLFDLIKDGLAISSNSQSK